MTTWEKIKMIKLGHRRQFGEWVVERVGTDQFSGDAFVIFKLFDPIKQEWVREKELRTMEYLTEQLEKRGLRAISPLVKIGLALFRLELQL